MENTILVSSIEECLSLKNRQKIKGSYLLYDDYQKARVKAMIDSSVIIIDDNSIKNYIRYVNNTYGRHFIDEFRS